MSFLGEIKRRKIFQVAAVYAVVAWLLIQIVATVTPMIDLPEWTGRLVLVLLAIGFPITLIMSWGFNLTPEGVVREGGGKNVVSKPSFKIEYLLFGLVAIAVAWLVYRVEFDRPQQATETSATSEQFEQDAAAELPSDVLPNSIAVLPFENLSPDPDNAYFAAGIHESTLNQLGKIRDLIVISRTTVMQYEENRPPIPEIARALNVQAIMEGSVRYANGRVLITAQLIDGRTDAHLWSDEFNRDLVDVFAVQAEVATQIAIALEAQLLPEERVRIGNMLTESTEAYQHYLHALSLPGGASSLPEIRLARIDSLQRAIALDPNFAEAYVELSEGYWFGRNQDLALEYAQKAIDLDPGLGEAYAQLAYFYRTYYVRQDEARTALEKAVELDPNNPRILTAYARALMDQSGLYEEAVRIAKRAVAIDPSDRNVHYWFSDILMRAGDFPAAVKHAQEATRLQPGDPSSYWMLATAQYLSGEKDAALDTLNQAVNISPPNYIGRLGYVAYLYGLLGEPNQAEALMARLKDAVADPERENWRYLRWATLGTRDTETALQEWTLVVDGYLEQGERVSPGTIGRFKDNWLNDPLLEEPEFLELRRRLGYEG